MCGFFSRRNLLEITINNTKIMKKSILMKIFVAIVMMCLGGLAASAQNHPVTGVVVDEAGLPVIGAGVYIVGTTTGVTTDNDGKFSINVPENATLQVMCLGYQTKDVVVGKLSHLNVVIAEDTQHLDELVFIGYGVQRRSDITGSVASVKAEDMKMHPATNISEMLRGMSTGVQVTSTSGAPGSSSSIQIRGARSLSASDSPLYVIDGVPATSTEFNLINSGDVESIEILKDAAAQAIYGARAANGVILVTTKRGKSGKPEVNFESTISVQTLWRNFEFYDPESWAELRRQAYAGDVGLHDPEAIAAVDPEIVFADPIMEKNWREAVWTNWEDLMIKPAVIQNYSLGVRGGGDKLKLAATIGYMNQDGMIDGSDYSRGNIRVNADYEPYKWLKIGVNTSANKSVRNENPGNITSFLTRAPYAVAFDEYGNILQYTNSSKDQNPLYNMQHKREQTQQDMFRLNGFVELRPFKGFTYKFNATQYARFAEIGSYKTSQYTGGGAGGSLSNSRDYNYVIENIINYQVPIKNDDHSLNLTLVHSWDKDYMTKLAVDADQVPVDSYWWNMIGDGVPLDIERTVSESILVSYLARAQYSYKGRYIFNGSLRYDGSSRFGENNKWALFPSVAGAWRISEEPFMQNVRPVSDLKLRLSWGSVGNQSGIGNYTTLGNATSYDMEFGDKYIIGYLPGGSLPNPNLKWETTTSTNFGLDFGFLKNRIHGSIEGYLTRTTDLLVSRQIESVLGYSSILDNLGETKTSGFEFSINADVISKKDFNWNVGLNISTFHNEIVRIDNRKDENGNYIDDVDNKWFIGHPINVYYDYRAEGIWQYDDFDGQDDSGKWIVKPTIDSDGDGVADKAIELKDVVEPGSVKLIDYNNDGKIDPSDRQIIERDPDFIAAFNTSLKWKGFDFYMDWYAVVGSVRRNEWLYDGDNGGSLQGKKNGIKVNYWTPSNPSNEFPRPIMGMWQSNQQSLAYQDASYLRLRTLSIGYTFPEKWLRNYNLRLALTATNLLTFTKYQSYNPEGNIESYPQPRQWAVSVNFNF